MNTKTNPNKMSSKYIPSWNVRLIKGFAGGHGENSPALVTLDISTEANTVEEVRAKVEALPDLLEACKMLMAELQSRFDYVEATPEEAAALCKVEAAVTKA